MADTAQRSLREKFDSGELRFGAGEIGGKAGGLAFFNAMLAAEFDPERFPGIETCVPAFAIVTTEYFDEFVQRNGLQAIAQAEPPDKEIAAAFQRSELSEALISDVRSLLEITDHPLAVRSSSLMEDAVFRPFAGVYETKMIPNNQADRSVRLRKVLEAIKLVYASTWFRAARNYIRATEKSPLDEKMAVVIQEIVGTRRRDRFYPLLSAVARSYNFYPTGGAKPEDGVVNLALGLGKTIVEGGITWTYSPARPQAPPPYGTIGELLKNTQLGFWCVNMGEVEDDPTAEAEHLLKAELSVAEEDDMLRHVASTYDPGRDRLVPGTGPAGPRVLNFAPLLANGELPVNGVVKELLAICERAAGAPVEIEFALAPAGEGSRPPRLGFLQVRPMFVSHELVDIADDEMVRPDLLLCSMRVMGNGRVEGIRDIVHVKREGFEARFTPLIAAEVEVINRFLLERGRPYLLVGFGRWGSSDPSLGIPVDWGQISGAKVIVEATLPAMDIEASQGAHFFHNISGNGVAYLSVHHATDRAIDWDWLEARPAASETRFLRHAELSEPLDVRLDGRSGRGGVWRG